MSVTMEQALPLIGSRVKVTFRGADHTPERPNHGAVIGTLLFAEESPPFGLVLMVYPTVGEKPVTLRGDAQSIEAWPGGPTMCSTCRALMVEP